ncbi:tol-pal system-associated acyl-CoA thioesterase [Afifella sp. YEN Y35]|uniref:tol-pal system-associated acyl-CoA thioesterase n=1 Tax=Afifella sp. YEN Y35 TaxID=3388337 RepID=UPI0039E18DAE
MTTTADAPAELSGRLTVDGHILHQRVYFEDTDFSGLVYHARYLHFLERGRSDFLRLLGVHHHVLAADGLAFAVRRMTIEFEKPARIDDIVTVLTRPEKVGGARVTLAQELRSGDAILVKAVVEAALLTGEGRPARLPGKVREALSASFKQSP